MSRWRWPTAAPRVDVPVVPRSIADELGPPTYAACVLWHRHNYRAIVRAIGAERR
jgi:hypothetical protein